MQMYGIPHGDGIPVSRTWRWSSNKIRTTGPVVKTSIVYHFLYRISWIRRISFVNSALFRLVSYNDPINTVGGSEIRRYNQLRLVVYLPLFTRFSKTSPVVGNGISEP